MKITTYTNVLARSYKMIRRRPVSPGSCSRTRPLIAVSLPSLCELIWRLRQGAKLSKVDVATAIRALLDAGTARR